MKKWHKDQYVKFSKSTSGANHWTSKRGGSSLSDKRRNDSLNEAISLASRFGGKCISDRYSGIDVKMDWKCSNGHFFQRSLYDVKHLNRWCQKCEKLNLREEHCRCIF